MDDEVEIYRGDETVVFTRHRSDVAFQVVFPGDEGKVERYKSKTRLVPVHSMERRVSIPADEIRGKPFVVFSKKYESAQLFLPDAHKPTLLSSDRSVKQEKDIAFARRWFKLAVDDGFRARLEKRELVSLERNGDPIWQSPERAARDRAAVMGSDDCGRPW